MNVFGDFGEFVVGEERREKWKTVDDRHLVRWVVVDYDEQGCAHVTREVMHDLLVRAGMRLALDAEEGL